MCSISTTPASEANDSLAFLEIYTSVQRSRLFFHSATDSLHPNDSLQAEFRILLELEKPGSPALSDTFSAVDIIENNETASAGQFFPHVFRFVTQPGDYQLRTSLFQYDEQPREVTTNKLHVVTFPRDSLNLSGVELGCDMEFTDKRSPYTKNGIRILPNPTLFFGTQLPMFYYYAEVYGIKFDSAAVDSYTVHRRIVRAETDSLMRPDVAKTFRLPGSEIVVADGFPATTIKTGTYFLELEVDIQSTGQRAKVRKKFWTYRPEDFAAGRTVASDSAYLSRLQDTEPSVLDMMDPDSALQVMKYLFSQDESARIKRLNPEGKRSFLKNYWIMREKTEPGCTDNYFAKVVVANDRYSLLKKPGWKTDRGRIFMLYGEPDHIDRNYGSAQMPDHEVWQYESLEGGVIFVFMDRNGFGELDLVHSTMKGEIYNPNWQDLSPSSRRGPGSESLR